jgi:phospholipid/cholesterol/gamma-HCH transport system ATP-binding protein
MKHNPQREPMPPGVLLRLEGLCCRFGDLEVLRGVTADFRTGQTTVVIGPSGCGKSVLLKHVIGLLRPTAGRVLFDGLEISRMPERQLNQIRRRFGFLFQSSALFDSMSVGENVGFALREHTRMGRRQIAERVRQKLAIVGLSGIERMSVGELSGGMKKRVGLARAIALDPEVILYDEPTTGLDPPRAETINDLIRKMQADTGVTSIVVTHDMHSARKVGDRIILLHEGRFVEDGTVEQIVHSRHPLVRHFINGTADEQRPHDSQDTAVPRAALSDPQQPAPERRLPTPDSPESSE